MSEELGAVLEAPEVIADEVVEPPSEVTEVVDPAAVVEEKDATDWRKVPDNLKVFFKTAEGKAAKDAWFERNAYKEKFPEGIKQVNELTAFLEEHGGREGLTTTLTEMQGKAAELDDISSKLVNDPAALVADIMAVAPDSLGKLAEAAVGQWAQADPEGWGSAMSGVMAATIQQNGIPMFLERMGLMLEVGKTDQIPAMIKQLQEWAGSFQAKASAPRTQPTKGPDKFAEREQSLNDREQKAFNDDMDRQVESFRTPQITKELDSFIKRRPNDADAKDLAINTVRSQVVERLKADQKFQDSLNALWARKDKDGAMRLIKSRETAAITEIAPKVGRTIFGNPGAVVTPVDKRPVGTPSKADAGFSFTDKAPAPHLIDKFRTTDAMIMRGKFILKDGKKLSLEA